MATDSHETMRDLAFVGGLCRELEEGRSFALSTIHATHGSMPRHADCRMVLFANGDWQGTIGGGRVEQMAQERCQRVLAGEEPASLEWMTHAKTGMACGGDALVSVRLVTPADLPALSALKDALKNDVPSILMEDWSDAAAPTFDLKSLVELGFHDPRTKSDGPLWDDETSVYSEPVGADPVAYIFGGGHVGRALVPALASVGFRVVVFDDRKEIATPKNFPKAERVILGDFKNVAEKVSVTARDYVVVLTHGHAGDIDVLEQVAPARPAYVGCIGSKGKAAFARKTLVERGVSAEWANGIHLPIGDNILAVTPPEIAVSIAAEMIRCRAELRPQKPHAKS